MIKIFVSGPYTNGDVAQNVKAAMDISDQLIIDGFAPYCPHLTHFLHINHPQPYEKWLELDIEFLTYCNGLLRLPGTSNGADSEVHFAKKRGIPVFFELGDLKNYFKTK